MGSMCKEWLTPKKHRKITEWAQISRGEKTKKTERSEGLLCEVGKQRW